MIGSNVVLGAVNRASNRTYAQTYRPIDKEPTGITVSNLLNYTGLETQFDTNGVAVRFRRPLDGMTMPSIINGSVEILYSYGVAPTLSDSGPTTQWEAHIDYSYGPFNFYTGAGGRNVSYTPTNDTSTIDTGGGDGDDNPLDIVTSRSFTLFGLNFGGMTHFCGQNLGGPQSLISMHSSVSLVLR